MTPEVSVEVTAQLPKGEARLVGPQERPELVARSEQDGYLVVCPPSPGPMVRGRLAQWFEESFEKALELRGACAAGVSASTDIDASLSDQLYRTRLLGKRGVALVVPCLSGITSRSGALDAEDSAALRWWLHSASDRPVRIYLERRNHGLGIYEAPTSLAEVLARMPPISPPQSQPEQGAGASSSPASVMRDEDPPAVAQVEAPAHQRDDNGESSEPPVDCTLQSSVSEAPTPTPPRSSVEGPLSPEQPATPSLPLGPLEPDAANAWPQWMQRLASAKGPQPLGTVEQLFVSAYVPLADALARDIAGPQASEVLRSWSTGFAKSYVDAFDALRLRGKRPMMVLDIPDIAQRMARLHGARHVQLILVDALRFDVGTRMQAALSERLGPNAALIERMLCWSSLPTTTAQQLMLLGRGPDGLRDMGPVEDNPVVVAKGRAAATLRRVRTGSREVLKLDWLQSHLAEPGPSTAQRLDELALSLSLHLATALAKMPARTLALVFGDHGFCLDETPEGTRAARQGGASPEEVLVPAYAWLLGSTH